MVYYGFLFVGACVLLADAIVIRRDCECGHGSTENISLRMLNGIKADPHAYPWMVYIFVDGISICSGTIINNMYVLTAAHCVSGLDATKIIVVISSYDRRFRDGFEVPIISYTTHEYFRSDCNTWPPNHDIALIKLRNALQFNKVVQPICLPNPKSNYSRMIATIVGWGSSYCGKMTRYLLNSYLRVMPDEECMKQNETSCRFLSGYHLCGRGYGNDSCVADSGSPIILEVESYTYHLIGIVTLADNCMPSNHIMAYLKINEYLRWIVESTKDAEYCNNNS